MAATPVCWYHKPQFGCGAGYLLLRYVDEFPYALGGVMLAAQRQAFEKQFSWISGDVAMELNAKADFMLSSQLQHCDV
jgi:hypothetical protein